MRRDSWGVVATPAVLRLLLMGVAVSVLLLVGGSFVLKEYYFEPLEATRQAEATAQALTLARTATAQAMAQVAAATEDALAMDRQAQAQATSQAATATQQAINLQAPATTLAEAQATTAAQQAIELRATAVAQGCAASDRYSLSVGEPGLFPTPGAIYVIGNPPFAMRVTWVVTNTGECAWEEVRLRPEGGGELIPVLEGEQVEPGQVAEISVPFAFSGGQDVEGVRDVEGEWVLVVRNPLGGDHVLFEQPHLRLRVEGWVIAVTPTPTPMSKPTPTQALTSTPTPSPTDPLRLLTPTEKPTELPRPTEEPTMPPRPTEKPTEPPPPPTEKPTEPPPPPTEKPTEPPPPPTEKPTEPPPPPTPDTTQMLSPT